jgi:hypothetical protein
MPTNDKSEGDSKFRILLAKTVKRVPTGYEREECNQTAFPPPTYPELGWKRFKSEQIVACFSGR